MLIFFYQGLRRPLLIDETLFQKVPKMIVSTQHLVQNPIDRKCQKVHFIVIIYDIQTHLSRKQLIGHFSGTYVLIFCLGRILFDDITSSIFPRLQNPTESKTSNGANFIDFA